VKQWTQHDARTSQTTEAGQFNAQHQAFRGELVGLDRSQLPDGALAQTQLTTACLHQCYLFNPWSTGVIGANGEQTRYRAAAADTRPEQWRAINYRNFGSGWFTCFETTLQPFKGGNLLTEWYGNCAIQTGFNETYNTTYAGGSQTGAPNEKFLGLRILYNGAIVAERIGPAKAMDHFSISGSQQMPSGPVTLTLQAKPGSAGPDDPVTAFGSTPPLMQCHLFANRVFAIGRFR
jgi:hypothetical protein